MKTNTRTMIYLPLAAVILTAALAIPAVAQQLVPFKGSLQGQDTDTEFTDTTVTVVTTGTGIGTHLGEFSFAQEVVVSFTTFTSTGTAEFNAANGDSLYTTVTGSGAPTDTPGVFSITDIHTITGGTGRFAGARGSFTVERLASAITFVTSGAFHGAITSRGTGH